MTGLWWWQNYQKSNEERDNLVQTYVEKEKTAELRLLIRMKFQSR